MTAPLSLPDVASEHHDAGFAIEDATAQAVAQLWAQVDPNRIVDSWAQQLPEAVQVVSAGQLASARQADAYVDEALEAQDLDSGAVAEVDPAGFAGHASDGRGLVGLLTNPVVVTLLTISDVRDVTRALAAGRTNLDMLVRTQVQDAGRLADQVSLTAHPSADGYIRITDGNPCARCLILSGRFYKWNRGFMRHPRCGCRHVPAGSGMGVPDPRSIFASMSRREQMRAGFTQADIRALDDGADIFQIVNARHRPGSLLTVAGEAPRGARRAQRTLEGISDRSRAALFRVDPASGRFVPRLAVDRPRWTVDEIYRVAGDDRDLAVDLLGEFGYLQGVTRQPTLRDLRKAAKASGMRRFSRQSRRELVERLEDLPQFPPRPRLAAMLAQGVRGGAPGAVVPGTRAAARKAAQPSLAALKARAVQHGVTPPTGIRRPALVKLVDDLDNGRPAAQALDEAVQSIIDERKAVGELLSEVDEALHNEMSARALGALAARLERLPVELKPKALADALRAGDAEAARTAMTALAKASKLKPVGAAGDVVALDRAKMSLVGAEGGSVVRVIRPGWETTVERRALVFRAEVQPVSAAEAAAFRAPAKVAKKAAVPKAPPAPRAVAWAAPDRAPIRTRARHEFSSGAFGDKRAAVTTGEMVEGKTLREHAQILASVRPADVAAYLDWHGFTKAELDRIRNLQMRLVSGDASMSLGSNIAPLPFTKAEIRELIIRDAALAARMATPETTAAARAYAKAVAKKATPAKKTPAPKLPPEPEKLSLGVLKEELKAAGVPESLTVNVPRSTLASWTRTVRSRTGDIAEDLGRFRQTVIDRRRDLADLLAEADELLTSGASASTMGTRAAGALKRWEAKAADWPELAEARKVVAALASGDARKIRTAIAAAKRKVGLQQIGPDAGKLGTFDRAAMKPLGGTIPDGAAVTVVRPGYSVEIGGQRVVLSRPVVEVADVPASAGVADRVTAQARTAQIESRIRRPGDAKRRAISAQGQESKTAELVFPDGTRVVEKVYKPGKTFQFSRKLEEKIDGEVLAVEVARALDLRAPVVIRSADPDTIYMEFVAGRSGTAVVKGRPYRNGTNIPPRMIESDEGRRLGLADYLMGNPDRNPGNFIVDADGRLVPIDHGEAFSAISRARDEGIIAGAESPFATYLMAPGSVTKLAKTIDISPEDLAIIRGRLEALRSTFERAGRLDWWQRMMDDLGELETRAVGTRSILVGLAT